MTAAVKTENGHAVLELTHEEVLAEFAAVMHEWGHCTTAEGLRFPTEAEVHAMVGRLYGGSRP